MIYYASLIAFINIYGNNLILEKKNLKNRYLKSLIKLFFVKPRPQTVRLYKFLKGKVRQKERRVK